MILDVKQSPACKPYEIHVVEDTDTYTEDRFRPFFIVVCDERYRKRVEAVIRDLAAKILGENFGAYRNDLAAIDMTPEEVVESIELIETDLVPLILDPKSYRYIRPIDDPRYRNFKAYVVRLPIPKLVATLARKIYDSKKDSSLGPLLRYVYIGEHNIRYTVRASLSIRYINFLDVIPIYYSVVDPVAVEEALYKYKALIYDTEDVREGGKRYLIISWVEASLGEEELDKLESRIETRKLEVGSDGLVKSEQALEDVRHAFKKARVIVDYNGTEYDRKLLVETGVLEEEYFYYVSTIDLLLGVRARSTAIGTGLTSHGLQDVAIKLAEKGKISIDRIIIKQRKEDALKSVQTAIPYNRNDVILTAAVYWVLHKLTVVYSALFKMPPSAVLELPSGLLYEYFDIKNLETMGYAPTAVRVFEDKRLKDLFTGQKVFTYKDIIEFFNKYVERLRKLLEEGKFDEYERLLWNIYEEFIRYAKKKARKEESTSSGGEEEEREFVGAVFDSETQLTPPIPSMFKVVDFDLESSDFAMTYPSFVLFFLKGDPCAFDFVETCRRIGISLDDPDAFYKIHEYGWRAVYNIVKYPAPEYAGLSYLYETRKYYKQKAKEYKNVDKKKAATYDIIQESMKQVINAYFGSKGKSTGETHLGQPLLALAIFDGTIGALGMAFAVALSHGYLPVYGDTDSLFMLVPKSEPKGAPSAKVGSIVKKLVGLDLDLKARGTFMYIYQPKSYVFLGDETMIKGKILADSKIVVPQGFRLEFLKAVKERKIMPFVEQLLSESDPNKLMPVISKRIIDMFVYTVQDFKGKRRDVEKKVRELIEQAEQEGLVYFDDEVGGDLDSIIEDVEKLGALRGFITVLYYDKAAGRWHRSWLKKLTPTHPNVCLRLIALAVKYGEGRGEKRTIDFEHVSSTDIADLKAVPLPQSRVKMSATSAIVMDANGNLLKAAIAPTHCSYVLRGRGEGEEIDIVIPMRYAPNQRRKMNLAELFNYWRDYFKKVYNIDITRPYRLVRVNIGVQILGKATVDELHDAILDALYTYCKSRGLDKVFLDFDKFEELVFSRVGAPRGQIIQYLRGEDVAL